MLESIEKLRELSGAVEANDVDNPFWVCCKAERIADEIEREISERYMLLPVDADGMPIHVDDEMCCSKHGITSMEVLAVSDRYFWWQGETDVYQSIAEAFHHANPRTVEDVLNDFAYRVCDLNVNQDDVARYADELRELLGGDAS